MYIYVYIYPLIVHSFDKESYTWEQAIARPRQRRARAEDKCTQLTSSTHNDLRPRLNAWEHLGLLAQLDAQELGFSAEVWNAVPSYVTPTTCATTSACSEEEEVFGGVDGGAGAVVGVGDGAGADVAMVG